MVHAGPGGLTGDLAFLSLLQGTKRAGLPVGPPVLFGEEPPLPPDDLKTYPDVKHRGDGSSARKGFSFKFVALEAARSLRARRTDISDSACDRYALVPAGRRSQGGIGRARRFQTRLLIWVRTRTASRDKTQPNRRLFPHSRLPRTQTNSSISLEESRGFLGFSIDRTRVDHHGGCC